MLRFIVKETQEFIICFRKCHLDRLLNIRQWMTRPDLVSGKNGYAPMIEACHFWQGLSSYFKL